MPLFQDGLTAQTYEADLYPENGKAIRIVYQDLNGHWQDLHWEVDLMTPEEFPGEQPRLYYGRLAQQSLQFESKAALAEFQRAFPGRQFIQTGLMSWEIWSNKTSLAALIVGLIALLGWTAFFGLPMLADQFAQAMPRSWEEEMGTQMAASIRRDENVLPKTTKLAQDFFAQCGYQTEYPVKVYVVEDRMVNAFAVPGGTIVVYTGLLEKTTRPEQLASLLGHELGHVQERHSLRLLSRSLATYILVSALLGDVAGVSAVLVDNGQQLQQLSYTRELEASADDFAITQMRRRHLDLGGMKELFDILDKESPKSDIKLPQFLNSHPLTTDRREKASQAAAVQKDAQANEKLDASFKAIKASLAKEGSGVL